MSYKLEHLCKFKFKIQNQSPVGCKNQGGIFDEKPQMKNFMQA
jgi:hypothetical protein